MWQNRNSICYHNRGIMQDGIDSLQSARGSSAAGAARGKGGYSLSQKRVSPFKSPERKVYIASEQLEELQCLPIALPCARRCRGWRCYTIWLAPIIRCRSAHLVAVRSNHRLPPVPTMRRAPAMPLFRTQSAAKQTSLAPHDSKARLRVVTKRRGSWRSHVHRT